MQLFLPKQQQYDNKIKKIIKSLCTYDSSCIVVGASKGSALNTILQIATNGNHYAFEPIPYRLSTLAEKNKHLKNCEIQALAISNKDGETTFEYTLPNPSYKKLRQTTENNPKEIAHTIEVDTKPLDDIIPASYNPTLIIIDVNGEELKVLEGAATTIKKTKTTIILKHYRQASSHSGATPEKLFSLLRSYGLRVSTMDRWLRYKPCLTQKEFFHLYQNNEEYYFIAYP